MLVLCLLSIINITTSNKLNKLSLEITNGSHKSSIHVGRFDPNQLNVQEKLSIFFVEGDHDVFYAAS